VGPPSEPGLFAPRGSTSKLQVEAAPKLSASLDDAAHAHLARCVELAGQALAEGSAPFGSVLVGGDGCVLKEARNRTAEGDPLSHPELELVRFAAGHMTARERRLATVYTSGEHCPMCAAAHALAGLGPIVFAASCEQLVEWSEEGGRPPSPLKLLPIGAIVRDAVVCGPVDRFAGAVRQMVLAYARSRLTARSRKAVGEPR
jgi:tRNA(Arg) A34 adenosine deaminase TadA